MKKLVRFLFLIANMSSVFAQKDSVALEEVSITANRASTGGRSATAFLVLKKETIAFSNPASAAHLLENSGQVLVQRSQGGGGSPIIRGFEANKVLLVMDGVRMNNAIYRGGHLQNVITIDPNMLERVEVLFGGHSLMYGSDALGGVMYFKTRKPQIVKELYEEIDSLEKIEKIKFGQKTNVFTRYASAYQEKTIHVDVNFAFEKFALLSSFTHSDFGDMRTGKKFDTQYGDWGKRTFYVERINGIDSIFSNPAVHVQKGTAYAQSDFLQKILFQANQNTSHIVNIQYSASSDIPRYDRLTETTTNGKPSTAEWYYGPQKRLLTSYHFENKKNTFWSDFLQVVAAYQSIEESRNTRNFGSSKRTQRVEKVEVMSVNADIKKIIGQNILFQGVEIQHNLVDSKATFINVKTNEKGAASTRYPDGGSAMSSLAYYLQYQHNTRSEKTQINTGIRYNYTFLKAKFIDKNFYPFPFDALLQKHKAIVGSMSILHRFPHQFNLSASISNAYRAPNIDDAVKIFESIAGRLIVPNTALKPEKTLGTDLVLSKKFKNGLLHCQLVPFLTFYKNALTLAPSQLDGKDSIVFAGQKSAVFSTQNLLTARVQGVSANIDANLSDDFRLSAAYTFTKGRVTSESTRTPLDHIPPSFGRFSIDFEQKKLQLSLFSLFNGAKKSSDYRLATEDNERYSADEINGFMPAWWTLNARASYKMTNNLTLQAAIENIFDQHYRVFASGVSAAGKNFSVTVRGDF